MWFKLADRQCCSVDYLKATMPITRFKEWIAYFQIENDTNSTTDNNLAHLSCLITNYLCKKKYTLKDFLPNQSKERFNKKSGENFFKQLAGIAKKSIGMKNG